MSSLEDQQDVGVIMGVEFSGSKIEFQAASFDLLIDAVESRVSTPTIHPDICTSDLSREKAAATSARITSTDAALIFSPLNIASIRAQRRPIHVRIEVEFIRSYCPHAALRVKVLLEIFLRKQFHSAAGVPNDHDLSHAQNVD